MTAKPSFNLLFPAELLNASTECRLAYFEQVIVAHPNFDELLADIFEKINPHSNRRIFLLVGATGTGKSALLRKLVEKAISEATNFGTASPEVVPAFAFRPEAPLRGVFKFEKLYEQALVCMNAPMIEASRDVLRVHTTPRDTVSRLLLESPARKDWGGLRTRCLNDLKDRHVRLWGVDEAKVLFMTGRSDTKEARKKAIEEMADRLKLLVEDVRTILLLSGGFDFYDLASVTSQLARRCRVFYFQPYTAKTIAGFQQGFIGLLSHIPTHHLIEASDGAEFFGRCDGAIGRVRDVLMDALFKHLAKRAIFDMILVREFFWEAEQEDVMRSESDAGDVHMQAVKANSEERAGSSRAKKGEKLSANPTKASVLMKPKKVGEAHPSHFKNESEQW